MQARIFHMSGAAGRKGFVLPAVLFTLAIMAILAVAAVRMSGDEQRSARSFRESGLALYVADAGLRKTLGAWPTASVKLLNAGDSLNLGWVALPNHTTYRPVIHRVDAGGTKVYAVIVQGRGAGPLGGQRTVTAMVKETPQSVFQLALFGKDAVTLGGGSVTDGYNSANGPYIKKGAFDSTGSIGSNGTISLTSTSIVNGDATAAGSAGSTGTVTGTRTSGAAPFPTPTTATCPTGYPPSVPGGGSNIKTDKIYYNPATGQLIVSGGAILTLPPGSTYHFSSITLSGNSRVIIDNKAGEHVDIYVDTDGYFDPSKGKLYGVDLSGGSVTNSALNKGGTQPLPTALNIAACGNPTRVPSPPPWTLSGGTDSFMTIYAPDNAVTASGNAAMFGAIVGKSIDFSGGFQMHYDEALANQASATPVLVVVSGSWTELTTF